MGKLVKRAELSVLGAIGIVLFSIAHFPAILSVLDDATSTDPTAYTAAAVAPYVEDTVTQPSQPVVTTTPIVPSATTTPDEVAPATPATNATDKSASDNTATDTPVTPATQNDTSGNNTSNNTSIEVSPTNAQ
jgi:hypothetical protein